MDNVKLYFKEGKTVTLGIDTPTGNEEIDIYLERNGLSKDDLTGIELVESGIDGF